MTIEDLSYHFNTPDPDEFILDSGATRHMSPCGNLFTNWKAFNTEQYVITATGTRMMAMGTGDIVVHTENSHHNNMNLVLKDVLYIPELTHTLVSMLTLEQKGYHITFHKQQIVIEQDYVSITGYRSHGRYMLNIKPRAKTRENKAYLTQIPIEQEDLKAITEQPNTWKDIEKLSQREQELWNKAMKKEVDNFNESQTWTPQSPPTNTEPIHTRWTYKVKRNEDNIVTKIRARLVAKGFEQTYGEQYDESYAPVIKPVTFRTLLVLAAQNEWIVNHIDVDSAFLYGHLKEDLYVHSPESPSNLFKDHKVFKLHAAIYGLKQASHSWYNRLKHSLNKQGFKSCESDPCLFTKRVQESLYSVITHVDDLLILGKEQKHIDHIIKTMQEEYSIKDLGQVKCYLGMHIHKNDNPPYYSINQRDKIINIKVDADARGYISSKIPILPDYMAMKLNDQTDKMQNVKSYQKLLGELLYLANTSRPDIAAASGILGRSAHSPSYLDWQALLRVVGYLKSTEGLSLNIGHLTNDDLLTYSDADWGGDPHTKRSTSGGCHMFHGSLVSWSSTRQKNVTLSTAESEYVAAVEAAKETLWISGLLKEIDAAPNLPLDFLCDNQSTIALISSTRTKSAVKHIAMRMQFLRELVDNGFIMMKHCRTHDMLADVFTKPLPYPRHKLLSEQLMQNQQESTPNRMRK